MKTFVITHEHGDTCGNTWVEDKDPIRYLCAFSMRKVWEHLGKPIVTEYGLGSKIVNMSRTPKGKGYGIWEKNPNFNWERDLDANHITYFRSGGFYSTIVREIFTENVE